VEEFTPESQKSSDTAQSLAKEELLQRLSELGGSLIAEDDVTFEGRKIILPANTTLDENIKFLVRKQDEDEKQFAFGRQYKYRPWDGAAATQRAIRKAFGIMGQKATRTMFGDIPPRLVTIQVGVDKTEQVPWGEVTVPFLPGVTMTLDSYNDAELGMLFQINAVGPRKFRHHVEGLFEAIANELKEHSIYMGQAIDGKPMPEFVDLSAIKASDVVYSAECRVQLETNLWAPIVYSDVVKELRVPLKRAVLLAGDFGVGKTLTAFLTAQLAVQHGKTFIYCRPNRDSLVDVMATARLYQPCVVFVEDVDVIASSEEGKDGTSQLLDLFDGITAKGTEILVVLTTNHPERIQKAMVRPGRLDAVVTIGTLDTQGIEDMAKANLSPEQLDTEIQWENVAKAMQGYAPAFVKEALNRASLYAVARGHGVPDVLAEADLVAAANGLRPQLDLMHEAKEATAPNALGTVFQRTMEEAATNAAIDVVGIFGEASGYVSKTDLKGMVEERAKVEAQA